MVPFYISGTSGHMVKMMVPLKITWVIGQTREASLNSKLRPAGVSMYSLKLHTITSERSKLSQQMLQVGRDSCGKLYLVIAPLILHGMTYSHPVSFLVRSAKC